MIRGTGYEVIIAAALSAFLAQFIKMLYYLIFKRQLNFQALTQAGGMPSSHSSLMCSMSTSVGLVAGWASVEFAIACGISFIVMYDAAGVRRAAGRMAGILNQMTEDVYRHHPERVPDRLKELLGHTPFEVFVGALFGIVLSFLMHEYLLTH